MQKIKIVTDSTVDLSSDILNKYDIHVIPLSIFIDGETYLDRVDLSPDEFIDKMLQAVELPKTSQPAVGAFIDMYNKLGEDGSEVISIHMTGGMSGTVSTARSAADMTDTKVTVIDSMFISHALSFQVIEAAKMAKEGRTVEEIIKRLDIVRANTYLYVVVDTLDNLVKGGRIGRGKALIGSLLNIKPIASLADGVYTPVAKVRSQNQVVKTLAKYFEEETAGKTVKAVGIANVRAIPLAQSIKGRVEEISGFQGTEIYDTCPIISTHTGVGAIGFMYFAE
ncbi:DegV family protein [Bacillus sp. 165]|uniref:DegV family protein n=1 Tax=Bacillus sp. 165 TaxID=1529117 RepID=UPI001ADD3186|nr:DegV family protein [Bacillus sp. 165]MBO9129340.1 DegV family protein [Bacillus sp. 165]